MALLAPIIGHACYLDLTLARKWKRLPVFMRGTSMHSRRVAIYYVPGVLACLGLGLFVLAIAHDISPGVHTDRELAIISAMTLGLVSVTYPVHVLRQRRWMRTGEPTIR